jgi:hypothetical protein
VNQDSSQEFQPRKISLLAPFSLSWRDKNKVLPNGDSVVLFSTCKIRKIDFSRIPRQGWHNIVNLEAFSFLDTLPCLRSW